MINDRTLQMIQDWRSLTTFIVGCVTGKKALEKTTKNLSQANYGLIYNPCALVSSHWSTTNYAGFSAQKLNLPL